MAEGRAEILHLFETLPTGWSVLKVDVGVQLIDPDGAVRQEAIHIEPLAKRAIRDLQSEWNSERHLRAEKQKLEKRLAEIDKQLGPDPYDNE